MKFPPALLLLCLQTAAGAEPSQPKPAPETPMPQPKIETAMFAGGCFWCTEAFFETHDGVQDVVSGYSGGTKKDPSYKEVTTGATGHAEVIRITFDPDKISYEALLRHFFAVHDPTTLNRQGADVGTQYRSSIFTTGEAQERTARKVLAELDASGRFASKIVTEIKPAGEFYPAEDYHQDYYRTNPNAPYSRYIREKIKKTGRPGG